jgi:formate hydrogenlyase subunit 3/multisubunit Na+/H+ antiporter MnhD subunit
MDSWHILFFLNILFYSCAIVIFPLTWFINKAFIYKDIPLSFILAAGIIGLVVSFYIPDTELKDYKTKKIEQKETYTTTYLFKQSSSLKTSLNGSDLKELHMPSIQFHYRIDGASRFFGGLISLFAIITSLFSFSYLSPKGIASAKGIENKQLAYIPVVFSLFLLAMTQIVYANDMILFLYCWEIMTLSSAAFAYFKQLTSDNAPKKEISATSRITLTSYIITGQLSTVLILVGFLITANTNNTQPTFLSEMFINNPLNAFGFLFLFCGFGIKAAIVPFHFWLPFINYSSPGNAHALHSSIMVKIGIYGIYRLLFSFQKVVPWMAELTILTGALTVIAGIQYAIAQHDLKKALAYHTIENIGIIVIGLGISALTLETAPAISALALIAALFHVFNHALFKGVLLLIVGEIELLEKTVSLDRLKGLYKKIPFASTCFLIGALSISAIPPLNGFASEWMTFQALIAGIGKLKGIDQRLIIFIGFAALAYGCAGTALCFTKICGLILFNDTEDKKDVKVFKNNIEKDYWGIMLSTGILAISCLLTGMLSGKCFQWIFGIFESNLNADFREIKDVINFEHFDRVTNPIFITAFIIISIALLLLISLMIQKRKQIEAKPLWNCGSEYHIQTLKANPSQISMFYLENSFFPKFERLEPKSENILKSTLLETPSYRIKEMFLKTIEFFLKYIQCGSDFIAKKIQNGDLRIYITYLLVSLFILFALFGVMNGSQ